MTIEELLAERACQNLVLDFAASVDARDYARLRELCAADVSFTRPSEPDTVVSGIEALISAYASRPPERLTQHLCTNIRITLESPHSARGNSQIVLFAADGSVPFTPGKGRKAASLLVGAFADRFVLTPEGWRFLARRGSLSVHL